MSGTTLFWLFLILVAAWPLILVGLFAVERGYPSGMPARNRWMFWAAMAIVYLCSCVPFFISGARARGILFLALGISLAAYAWDQRRRSIVSGSV
jgi:hypothetical protein